MQCDRAQEFFSDYLERTLDRPMTVALESHLSGCALCREDIEALQATLFALEVLPEVTPPADGAWQVMNALRQARAEQYELTRGRTPGFMEWLRSLNPMSVTMGAGLATLIIGGTLFATNLNGGVKQVQMNFLPFKQHAPKTPSAQVAAVSEVPALGVTFGALTAQGPQVDLHVTPPAELPDTHVTVTVTSQQQAYEFGGPSAPSRPLVGALVLPQGGAAEVLRVSVTGSGKSYQYTVLVPPGARRDEPITLASYDQPVEEALRNLGPFMSTPVVIDGAEGKRVSLSLNPATPAAALKQLADQISATVRTENGGAHLAAK